MLLFAQIEIVLTCAITAVASVLVAALPVWLKLRHERIIREEEARASMKQKGTLESDVDQLENQVMLGQNRVQQLEAKVAQLENELSASRRMVSELRDQLTQVGQVPPQAKIKNEAPVDFRPVLVPEIRRAPGNQAKRAYLVGAEPLGDLVRWLVKVHDYRGKAIDVYDLLTGECTKEADANTADIDARIARYGQIGREIDHPGDIRLENISEWIAHAKRAALRLGLRIEGKS